MTHGSLFSGIGGFDLAAQWMGWTNEFHCEINPFGRKVLHHYWPDATQYHDIKTTDFSIHRGLGILTGGFPCQPYSAAGKRLGKEDDRHLWPEMLRAVREISPRWIVGENVRGITNWNGGMVFDEVQADLETEGYQVTPFLLPAGSVNAPHRRDRIWFVAHAANIGQGYESRGSGTGAERGLVSQRFKVWGQPFGSSHDVTNSHNRRGPQTAVQAGRAFVDELHEAPRNFTDAISGVKTQRTYDGRMGRTGQQDTGNRWEQFPTVTPICGGDDGVPRQLDGITFPKWRNESIKAYGNAIVPQVVYQIFQAIEQYESLTARPGTK